MGKQDVVQYDTDVTMGKLWLHLVEDFRNTLGNDYAVRQKRKFLECGIIGLRAESFPSRSTSSIPIFKRDYQLESLFKRYRFKNDTYTDEQLESITTEKFVGTQVRIGKPMHISQLNFVVLRKARSIISSILQEYNEEEHMSLSRFGKRACIGTGYRESYLDSKLSRPLTGSHRQISWFQKYLETDRILSEVLNKLAPKGKVIYEEIDTLNLTNVPKSYKSYRSIMPNTLIGSFYTYGLGRVIQKRLLTAKLNIRTLQKRHRKLVELNSITRRLATADLSAASDSITIELLRRLLPCSWFNAILFGRIPQVRLPDGSIIRANSVATMGIGFTFPLQTLIFYGLLKAIAELDEGSDKYVSVYGDDLVYPSRLHKYVKQIFPDLHLQLNEDKTYVKDFFRESCGSDYYRGCDVRPFQPEGEHIMYSRQPYGVFLYKLLNGLKLRWREDDIPQTLEYLKTELILSQGLIYQVPPSFPDGSGLKVDYPSEEYFMAPVSGDEYGQQLVFNYLRVCSDFRVVKDQFPFYWERLRSSASQEERDVWEPPQDEPSLIWHGIKHHAQKLKAKRRKPVAGVASKTCNRILVQTGKTFDWPRTQFVEDVRRVSHTVWPKSPTGLGKLFWLESQIHAQLHVRNARLGLVEG